MLQKAHFHGGRLLASPRRFVALALLIALVPFSADGQKMPWRHQPIGQKFSGVEPHWGGWNMFDGLKLRWPWTFEQKISPAPKINGYLESAEPALMTTGKLAQPVDRNMLISEIERDGVLLATVFPPPEPVENEGVDTVQDGSSGSARKLQNTSPVESQITQQEGKTKGEVSTVVMGRSPNPDTLAQRSQSQPLARSYQGNTPLAKPEDFIYFFNDEAHGNNAVIGIPFVMPYLSQPRAVTPPSEAIYQQVQQP